MALLAVRVSFDGYGCCTPAEIARMPERDSAALLAMVAAGTVEEAEPILRRYFRQVSGTLWADALEHHELL